MNEAVKQIFISYTESTFPTQKCIFCLDSPKKCLYLHCEKQVFVMRRKSILLDSDSLNQLAVTGRCKVEKKLDVAAEKRLDVTIDTIYKVSGVSDCCVRAVEIALDGITFELAGNMVGSFGQKELRMAKLEEYKAEGAFIEQRKKFALGEVVAVAESYSLIVEQMDSEEASAEFMHRVAEAYKEDLEYVRAVSGWYNADKVKPELMPKRIRIVDIEKVRVQDLTDADWDSIGVKSFSEYYKELKRKAYVGSATWNANKEVILYRYECERS